MVVVGAPKKMSLIRWSDKEIAARAPLHHRHCTSNSFVSR